MNQWYLNPPEYFEEDPNYWKFDEIYEHMDQLHERLSILETACNQFLPNVFAHIPEIEARQGNYLAQAERVYKDFE